MYWSCCFFGGLLIRCFLFLRKSSMNTESKTSWSWICSYVIFTDGIIVFERKGRFMFVLLSLVILDFRFSPTYSWLLRGDFLKLELSLSPVSILSMALELVWFSKLLLLYVYLELGVTILGVMFPPLGEAAKETPVIYLGALPLYLRFPLKLKFFAPFPSLLSLLSLSSNSCGPVFFYSSL